MTPSTAECTSTHAMRALEIEEWGPDGHNYKLMQGFYINAIREGGPNAGWIKKNMDYANSIVEEDSDKWLMPPPEKCVVKFTVMPGHRTFPTKEECEAKIQELALKAQAETEVKAKAKEKDKAPKPAAQEARRGDVYYDASPSLDGDSEGSTFDTSGGRMLQFGSGTHLRSQRNSTNTCTLMLHEQEYGSKTTSTTTVSPITNTDVERLVELMGCTHQVRWAMPGQQEVPRGPRQTRNVCSARTGSVRREWPGPQQAGRPSGKRPEPDLDWGQQEARNRGPRMVKNSRYACRTHWT